LNNEQQNLFINKMTKRLFSTQIKRLPQIVFFHLLLIIVLGNPSPCNGGKISVVASIFPIADLVKQVGGDYVEVTTIIPPGASPHTFEPKPSLVKKIHASRVLFLVGAGLEFWAEKFIKSSGDRLHTVVFSEGIPLIGITDHHHQDKENHPHGESFANPHIWLDPEITRTIISKIVTTLGELDTEHENYYKQNGSRFEDELEKLDGLIRSTVSQFKTKKYVAFHPAWAYFARRYGLESVGTIEETPGKNPTPRYIKRIIEQIKAHEIQAVFAEPQLNPRVAEVIAKEANVRVLLLDPVGGPGLRGRSTYLDLMRYNLKILEEAMR